MTNTQTRQTLWGIIRNAFGKGIVILVPIVITVWVLNILFNAIDGIISPVMDKIVGRHIPGVGFATMIVLILFIGLLSRNLIGNTIFKYFERLLVTLPLARTIYSAMKEIVRAFQLGSRGKSFRQVVLVEYPRNGLFTMGFVTNELTISGTDSSQEVVSVYIPNPPNPTSGVMIFIPRDTVQILDMTVEEGLKLLLSGGIVSSGPLKIRQN